MSFSPILVYPVSPPSRDVHALPEMSCFPRNFPFPSFRRGNPLGTKFHCFSLRCPEPLCHVFSQGFASPPKPTFAKSVYPRTPDQKFAHALSFFPSHARLYINIFLPVDQQDFPSHSQRNPWTDCDLLEQHFTYCV